MKMKASMNIKLRTKGIDTLKRRLKASATNVARVGFFEESMSADGEMQMAELAMVQEYGREASALYEPIPARPFFRASVMSAESSNSPLRFPTKNALQRLLDGSQTAQEGLNQMGRDFEDLLKATITYWDDPANAPRTIEDKGFDDPLVETGTMRDSVKTKVVKRGT